MKVRKWSITNGNFSNWMTILLFRNCIPHFFFFGLFHQETSKYAKCDVLWNVITKFTDSFQGFSFSFQRALSRTEANILNQFPIKIVAFNALGNLMFSYDAFQPKCPQKYEIRSLQYRQQQRRGKKQISQNNLFENRLFPWLIIARGSS